MPRTRVPAYRCGTMWSGWFDGAHPAVEDGEISGKVCFSDRFTGCKYTIKILVKMVDHFTSTNWLSPLFVIPATVARTKHESKNFTK